MEGRSYGSNHFMYEEVPFKMYICSNQRTAEEEMNPKLSIPRPVPKPSPLASFDAPTPL